MLLLPVEAEPLYLLVSDYSRALFTYLNQTSLNRLQSVQNTAARLLTRNNKSSHTPMIFFFYLRCFPIHLNIPLLTSGASLFNFNFHFLDHLNWIYWLSPEPTTGQQVTLPFTLPNYGILSPCQYDPEIPVSLNESADTVFIQTISSFLNTFLRPVVVSYGVCRCCRLICVFALNVRYFVISTSVKGAIWINNFFLLTYILNYYVLNTLYHVFLIWCGCVVSPACDVQMLNHCMQTDAKSLILFGWIVLTIYVCFAAFCLILPFVMRGKKLAQKTS